MFNKPRLGILMVATLLLNAGWPHLVQATDSEGVASRQYWIDAAVYSFVPDEGIDSHRSYGAGSSSANATVGYTVAENDRRFGLEIEPQLESHRFMATVTVEPKGNDARTKALSRELDLSDLRPQTVDIARDDDGRVYRLNLMPRVIEHPKPKPFKVSDLRLDSWSFPSSPVILNDQQYLGRLGSNYGQLAWCDIPGLAKFEFSLLRLKDAHPWGILENGTINIAHPDGTTIRISNVKNGRHGLMLEGGPYQVWVRWSEPTYSVEEHRRLLKDYIKTLKQQAAAGDTVVNLESIERLVRISESDQPALISNGVRGVRPEEVVSAD